MPPVEIVDHDRMQAVSADLVGMIEDQGGTELADRGRAIAFGARHFQHGFLIEIVAAEVLIRIEDDRIGLEKRGNGAARGSYRVARIDGVAEVAGITEVVTGRQRGGIGGGEGREQRVRIPEIDAFVADFGHRRRRLWRHNATAQTVGHEQDEIAGRAVLPECRA